MIGAIIWGLLITTLIAAVVAKHVITQKRSDPEEILKYVGRKVPGARAIEVFSLEGYYWPLVFPMSDDPMQDQLILRWYYINDENGLLRGLGLELALQAKFLEDGRLAAWETQFDRDAIVQFVRHVLNLQAGASNPRGLWDILQGWS